MLKEEVVLILNALQTQVRGPWEGKGGVVKQVACGPWSSFVIVEEKEEEDAGEQEKGTSERKREMQESK